MSEAVLKLVGISGSLRQASHNTALLKTAAKMLPESVELTLVSIGELPFFNSDLTDESALKQVEAFKKVVSEADGLLIASPEYNYSVTGVLKNALDWASRPTYKSPLAQKPVGVLSAAASWAGGARSQAHLKAILGGVIAQVFPYPEFLVGRSFEKFTAEGELTDDTTRELLQQYLATYVEWVQKVR